MHAFHQKFICIPPAPAARTLYHYRCSLGIFIVIILYQRQIKDAIKMPCRRHAACGEGALSMALSRPGPVRPRAPSARTTHNPRAHTGRAASHRLKQQILSAVLGSQPQSSGDIGGFSQVPCACSFATAAHHSTAQRHATPPLRPCPVAKHCPCCRSSGLSDQPGTMAATPHLLRHEGLVAVHDGAARAQI